MPSARISFPGTSFIAATISIERGFYHAGRRQRNSEAAICGLGEVDGGGTDGPARVLALEHQLHGAGGGDDVELDLTGSDVGGSRDGRADDPQVPVLGDAQS